MPTSNPSARERAVAIAQAVHDTGAYFIADGIEQQILAAERAARDDEREACAKVCGEMYSKYVRQSLDLRFSDQVSAKEAATKTYACNEIAAAIRARKETP